MDNDPGSEQKWGTVSSGGVIKSLYQSFVQCSQMFSRRRDKTGPCKVTREYLKTDSSDYGGVSWTSKRLHISFTDSEATKRPTPKDRVNHDIFHQKHPKSEDVCELYCTTRGKMAKLPKWELPKTCLCDDFKGEHKEKRLKNKFQQAGRFTVRLMAGCKTINQRLPVGVGEGRCVLFHCHCHCRCHCRCRCRCRCYWHCY